MKFRLKIIHWVIINQLVFISLLILLSFVSLRNFNEIDRTVSGIQRLSSQVLALEKELMASVLDEESYQKKFQVLKDPDFERLYLKARDHSEKLIVKLSELLRGETEKRLLARISDFHLKYSKLVSGESESKENEKEKHLDSKVEVLVRDITKNLELLIEESELNIRKKIDQIGELTIRFHKLSLVLLIVVLTIGLILSIYIYLQLQPPIRKLIKSTRAVAEGDFTYRVEIGKENELGELALSFNNMCNRLQELDKLKADFLANMSHAFKTPLTTVQEAARLLLDGAAGEISEQQRRLVEIIESDNRNLVTMINEVLQVSRIETQMSEINCRSFDFSVLVKDSLNRFNLLAEKRNIRIMKDFDEQIPAFVGDYDKLSQVVDNLLENAIKYTEEAGRIIVTLRTVRLGSNNFPVPRRFTLKKGVNYLGFEVFNTGKPIEKSELIYIFEKFYQGKQKPRIKGSRGSGLGLYIVKYFVERHNGVIWAEGLKRKGTAFRVLLPFNFEETS